MAKLEVKFLDQKIKCHRTLDTINGKSWADSLEVTRPALFIGSSSEGKKFALAIQAALQPDAEATTWDQGIFAIGETFIENLMAALSRFDFAVLVLTPDDIVQSRSAELSSPRDNVIFELGLFMGKLGRDRTFILRQSGSGIKIPTDLAGATTGYYDWPRADMNHKAAVATSSEAIRDKIQSLGKRENSSESVFAGLDSKLVFEKDGIISAKLAGCEIATVTGRIEDYPTTNRTVVVLPCNEYFDDECAYDTRSAPGAYVNRAFPGRVDNFISCVKSECEKRLGAGTERQKKEQERAFSFGAGRAILMPNVLGSGVPVALVSTTTQRAGQGLISKTSFLFESVCELVTRLVDERLNEIVMPVLGAGHGGMDPATAFVSLVLALAEAIKYAPGRPLRSATVVIFKEDARSASEVDPVVVRRALALAGAPRHLSAANS